MRDVHSKLLQLIADGLQIKEAAADLGMSVQVAKNHLYQIRELMGADTTTQAVAMAIRRQLIT